MTRLSCAITLVALLLFFAGCKGSKPGEGDSQEGPEADFSILFIGNSHTASHNLPKIVGDMIRFRHPEKTVYTSTKSVAFLEDTANDPAFRGEIESRRWTAVVLQAQKISQSGKNEYSRKEGLDLAASAKARGSSVVFYPEWGLRGIPGDGARQEKVYREMARDAGVAIAPVARAWDLALAEQPEMVLHSPDGNHQSALGAFLTACVLCGHLTGADPTPLAAFPYPDAIEADRKFLAEMAAKALLEKGTDPPGR